MYINYLFNCRILILSCLIGYDWLERRILKVRKGKRRGDYDFLSFGGGKKMGWVGIFHPSPPISFLPIWRENKGEMA